MYYTVCFYFSHQSTVCFEVALLLWVAQPFAHKAQFVFKTPCSVPLPLQGKIVEVYSSRGDQYLGSCCFLVIC